MAEIALGGLHKAEETFKVKVDHLVTDGASNMKRMREIVQQSVPHIVTYHCQPHLLNLLAKDVQKMQQANIGKILTVLKYLRNKHAANAELDARSMNKPPLPCETRWNTLRDSLQYYCNNWANLVSIFEKLEGENSTERRNVENIMLQRAANELLQIFDIISAALNLLQSDTSSISTATECWLQIVIDIGELHNVQVLNAAKKRQNEALNNNSFLAAHLLDNRYRGRNLSAEQLTAATEYIVNRNQEANIAIAQYIAETGPYSTKVVTQDMDPVTYWKVGKRLKFDASLCDLALQLATAVCNSAGLERQFSTLKLTYGSLRTNLPIEKAGKLAFCYRTLNA